MISISLKGQIVYTDIADTTIYATDTLYIDINNDDINDFSISTTNPGSTQNNAHICGLNGNTIAAYQGGFAIFPNRFEENETISTNSFLIETSNGILCEYPCSYSETGPFGGAIDAFIGLKLDANVLLGWLQVDVSSIADWITIKGYAYNSNPSESITTPTITEISKIADDHIFEIYPNPAYQKLFFNVTDFDGLIHVCILNIEGQIVFEKNITASEEIDIANLKVGVYLIKVQYANINITEKLIKVD